MDLIEALALGLRRLSQVVKVRDSCSALLCHRRSLYQIRYVSTGWYYQIIISYQGPLQITNSCFLGSAIF